MKVPPRSRGHQTLHFRGMSYSEVIPLVHSVGIYSDIPLKYEIYSERRCVGSFLTEPVSSRVPKKEFEFFFRHGDFWVDVENVSDEEVQFWYQIQGCWIVDEQSAHHYRGRSFEDYAKEVTNKYKIQGYPYLNLNTNKIENEEERNAREEQERIERERRREEQEKAKTECSDLLNRLEEVTSYEEVEDIENQIKQKLEEYDISFFYFSNQVDQAKNRIRDHLRQEAEAQAWSELTEEIGIENANGIKNGNYYVFQGENKEWFAIGGPSNYLYNLDREQKYCLTVQSETRIPEPDQILAKIMWAKNDVEYVFDKGNVVGGLTEKLEETKRELSASKHLSIRELIKKQW